MHFRRFQSVKASHRGTWHSRLGLNGPYSPWTQWWNQVSRISEDDGNALSNSSSIMSPFCHPQPTPIHWAVPFSVGSEKFGTIVISSSLAMKYICKRY